MRIKTFVAAAAVLLGLGSAVPAQAQVGYSTNVKGELTIIDCAGGPAIRIEDANAQSLGGIVLGMPYTVLLDCFQGTSQVTVSFGDTLVGTVTTDGSGHAKLPITLGCDMAPGTYRLRADGTSASGAVASAAFDVTVAKCGTTKEVGEKKRETPKADAASGAPAFTGSNVGTQVGAGAGLLAAGAALVVAFRRRRATNETA